MLRQEREATEIASHICLDAPEASWMQRPGDQPPAVSENLVVLQVEIRSGLTRLAETGLAVVEWNGYLLLASRCTLKRDLLS